MKRPLLGQFLLRSWGQEPLAECPNWRPWNPLRFLETWQDGALSSGEDGVCHASDPLDHFTLGPEVKSGLWKPGV